MSLPKHLFFTEFSDVSLSVSSHFGADTIVCKLFLFLTLRLKYQEINEKQTTVSIKDL